MNKTLHRSQWAIAVGLLASLTSGCATSTVGLVSGPFSQESLAERRMSAAQTPIARSNALQAEKRRAESGSYGSYGPQSQPQELSDIALASYNSDPQASGSLVSNGNVERPVESFAVPREPIGMLPQTIDPTVPAVGSPYRLTGHGRPMLGGHAAPHSQGECTSCGIGQRYRPMFPQIHGSCGTVVDGSCPTDCGPACGPECAPEMRCADPQEYIFDGGDRDPQVRIRDDMSQSGLDPEDTVIQYTTANGQTLVQSGCRVAIYAPRFASVRKRTGPMTADLALRPQTSVLPDGPGVVREQLPPVNIVQPVRPIAKDAVRVVEAFRERQRPMPTDRVLPMGELSDAFKPFEDLDLIRSGDLLGTDPAKLALAAAAARIWSNVDQLKVLVDGQEAVVVTDLKQPQEVLTYEFKGARIRLCKVASEQIAHPGDVISFTIRFDNVGDSPLKNLVVTDSLAPRLEYVEASQQSSLPASFSATPNEAGSKVLRWELDNPIKPGEGGIVRFDAKVR